MYRIMLADDEGIVLDSLKMIIEKHFPGECQIETAKTGRDVIELAETFRPDIPSGRSRKAALLQSLLFCLPMINLTMPERPLIWGY